MPKAFEHYTGIIARCMHKTSCGDTFVPVWTLICIQMRMAGLSTARSGKVHPNQWPVDTNKLTLLVIKRCGPICSIMQSKSPEFGDVASKFYSHLKLCTSCHCKVLTKRKQIIHSKSFFKKLVMAYHTLATSQKVKRLGNAIIYLFQSYPIPKFYILWLGWDWGWVMIFPLAVSFSRGEIWQTISISGKCFVHTYFTPHTARW